MHGLKMESEIGIKVVRDQYFGRFAVHLDCFYWVKRDSYLPQGSHGLKKVTSAKLGYNPVELDPELMMEYAQTKPRELAAYSVSDALATYYLYTKLIHDFVFALCTIIPSGPDDVLRKGSGTLCEELLMAQAYRGNIIFPNKQRSKFEKFHNGHLLENETYIGGHVESLQTGIYRADFEQKFTIDKEAYQSLVENLDRVLDFGITIDNGLQLSDVTNREEVKAQVLEKIQPFLDHDADILSREPLIYHVDVGAMYPNIILSNRLQPVAIVNDEICAGCLHNKESSDCKRKMEWQWKGSHYPLLKKEYENIKKQLIYEEEAQGRIDEEKIRLELKKRVKSYSQQVYRQTNIHTTELKEDVVCMRENSFYVDTVKDFTERRYEFKGLVKTWKKKVAQA